MKKNFQLTFTFLAILLAWHLSTVWFHVPEYILPGPFAVFRAIVANFPSLLAHSAYTGWEITIGFALGFLISVGAVILSVYSRFIDNIIYELFSVLQMIPKVALAPLFLIWIGYGSLPKIIIAALFCLFPIALNFKKGLDAVDQHLIDIARSVGCTKTQILKNIQLPFSLPFLFSGLRLGLNLSVIGAVLGEFIGATKGLGYLILYSNNFLETPRTFAAIFFIAVIGIMFNMLLSLAEKKLVFWQKKPILE